MDDDHLNQHAADYLQSAKNAFNPYREPPSLTALYYIVLIEIIPKLT